MDEKELEIMKKIHPKNWGENNVLKIKDSLFIHTSFKNKNVLYLMILYGSQHHHRT